MWAGGRRMSTTFPERWKYREFHHRGSEKKSWALRARIPHRLIASVVGLLCCALRQRQRHPSIAGLAHAVGGGDGGVGFAVPGLGDRVAGNPVLCELGAHRVGAALGKRDVVLLRSRQ